MQNATTVPPMLLALSELTLFLKQRNARLCVTVYKGITSDDKQPSVHVRHAALYDFLQD